MDSSGAAGQRGSGAALEEKNNGQWRLWVDESPRPGYTNMAIDLALLDRTERLGEIWLRLYRWNPHCLSFGRHEPAVRRYDVDRIKRLGLDTVRRPTGGRAVWHATELTYAVTAPTGRFASMRAAYLEIHQLLREALRSIGVQGSLAPTTRMASLDAGSCFSHPAGGEVLVNGRKIVGSAQLRRGSSFLQHGSILLEDAQVFVDTLRRGGSREPASSRELPSFPLGRQVDPLEMAEVVTRTAATRWGSDSIRIDDEHEILEAASGYFPSFQSADWTWAR
jgi:lipoyl(octanoyl) transferase